MKIGISDMYLDALGGGEKYMLSIASSLSQESDVALFWDDKSILERAKKRFALELEKVKCVPNIFSSSISTPTRIAETKKYDVIIHLSDGSIPFSFAKRTYLHLQHPINWIKHLSAMDKVKLLSVKKIICNSEYTKKSVEKLFPKPCVVLYPPCQMIGEGEKKENIILTVGRYNKLGEGDFKKLGEMIELFKEYVDQTKSEYTFILVVTYKEENGKDIEQLKERIGKYNVKIVSDLSNEEFSSLYKRARIYWHAAGYQEDLEEHPERAEHFGISVVEAMSAGCIPVVIKAGGIPEIITHSDNGFLWSTKEELFTYTKQVSEDTNGQKEMKRKAVERAKEFSEESFFKHVKEIIYE